MKQGEEGEAARRTDGRGACACSTTEWSAQQGAPRTARQGRGGEGQTPFFGGGTISSAVRVQVLEYALASKAETEPWRRSKT